MTHYAANETQAAALLGECPRRKAGVCSVHREQDGKVLDWSLLLWVRDGVPQIYGTPIPSEQIWTGPTSSYTTEKLGQCWHDLDEIDHASHPMWEAWCAFVDESDGLYVLLNEVCETCGPRKQSFIKDTALRVCTCTDGHRYRLEALELCRIRNQFGKPSNTPLASPKALDILFRQNPSFSIIINPETREWWAA